VTGNIKKQLDAIFYPRSIAFIGASNDRAKWGGRTLQRALRGGYRGRMYPVNPKEKVIQGLRAYESVLDIPDEIDLVAITVPAPMVPKVMEDCVTKGVKGAVVISAGFAETGEEGRVLQDELVRIAREGNIRVVGPNCMGIWSAPASLSLAFDPAPRGGPIAFISQSGTFGGYLMEAAGAKGYGFSRFVSAGNQADLNASDYLEYLAEDNETKAIVFYLEGLNDGRRFYEIAREVIKHKPIALYKAGRTSAAKRATLSHTGSLAGSDQIFDAMCRQVGILRAFEAVHPFDMAEAVSHQPIPAGKRVAIIAGGGGYCVSTAEACASLGLELPLIDSETQKKIKAKLLPHAAWPVNPIDTAADNRPGIISWIAEQLAALDYIDGIIAQAPMLPLRIYDTEWIRQTLEATERFVSIPKKYGKPVIANVMGAIRDGNIVANMIHHARIPMFDTPDDCARGMYAIMQYGEAQRKALGQQLVAPRDDHHYPHR
jgi:acetyltransferase